MAAMFTTAHWRQRCAERLGQHVCPLALADHLARAIDAGSEVVQYIGRQDAAGKRVFRFSAPDGRPFRAVLNTRTQTAITLYPEEWT